MIHRYISSDVIIGETYSNYNIKSSAWESNAPMWIYHALGKIGINRFTVDREPMLLQFVDSRFELPHDATLISKIHFFEDPPDEEDYHNAVISGEINVRFTHSGTWIHVHTLEEGYVLVKYKSFPVIYNEISDQYFPIIPDDEPLKDALRVYLLMQILMTGYVHQIYNLTINNPWINPQFMFEDRKKKAKISVGRLDPIDRHKISNMISTFISPRLSKSFYLQDINR